METINMKRHSYFSCFISPIYFSFEVTPCDGKLRVGLGLVIPEELPGVILPERFLVNSDWLTGRAIKSHSITVYTQTLCDAMDIIIDFHKSVMSLVTSGANTLLIAQAESKDFVERMESIGWKKIK